MRSIKKKIIALVTVSIVVLGLSSTLLLYFQTVTKINPLVKSMTSEIVNASSNEISTWLKGKADEIQSLSKSGSLKSGNEKESWAYVDEVGKGFSVVAEEIRKLAEESAVSTQLIKVVVQELRTNANYAVGRMKEIGEMVERQGEKVKNTEDYYKDISQQVSEAGTQIAEISAQYAIIESSKNNVYEVLAFFSSIAEESAASTEKVSASTEEQSAQVLEISSQSEKLVKIADILDEELARFII